MTATRAGTAATLSWWSTANNPDLKEAYSVSAEAYEIYLNPDPATIRSTEIVDTTGRGSITLELDEGLSYFFSFIFTPPDLSVDNPDWKLYVVTVAFSVSIPISEKTHLLLNRVAGKGFNFDQTIKHELRTYLDKQRTFDEMVRKGLSEIKSQGLPADEEELQINNFRDYAEQIKERMGM